MTLAQAPAKRRFAGCLFGGQASVRACLLWVVLACVLPAALVASLLIWEAYREGRIARVERATVTSRSIMNEVDDELSSAAAGLHALAASPSLASGDLAAFHAQARQVLPTQAGNNFVLSDLSGQQLVNTLVDFGQPLPAHGNAELQRRAVETGRVAVSDLFIGGVTRRPLVAVEVPVFVEGRVAYTLAMGFFPDRLGAVLSNLGPEPDWVIAVFDRSGRTVARSHMLERFIGQKGAPALAAAMERSNHGVVETDTLEGVPVLAAFSRSPKTGWAVAVGIPRQALMAQLQRWVAWLVAATLALLLLGVTVASRIARRVAQSIGALVLPAESLGRGEAVQVPELPLQEADTVAQAMARASRLLQARTTERDTAAQATMAARLHAQRMEHAAHHDALTHLANRAHFVQALRERMEYCAGQGGALTVFFVDLDDFKPVNDRYGHAVGDDLLRSFAARLVAGVRSSDLVARLGGDEFAVLLDGLAPHDARPIAHSLSERLSRPYMVDNVELRVTACIGIAGCPDQGRTAEALLEAADAAMYRAKAQGKGGYVMSGFGEL